jgi:hypothetical protein
MATQKKLDGDLAGIDRALVYYRPVKSKERLIDPKKQTIESPSELDDVGELLKSIKSQKLDYPLPLSDSKMREMRSDRIHRIFDSNGNESFVRDLLGLFCDQLTGKQKAKNKYAMLIHYGGGFLLAHIKADPGMSLQEDEGEIELIRRFLDADNILSAALFEQDDSGDIEFSHFTDSGSDSFRTFLGIHEHKLNYRRKTIQILCYYDGRRSYDCKFEFTKAEFSDNWLRDSDVSMSGNKLRFDSDEEKYPVHEIKEIRWGNSTYESIEKFKSDFKEESLGLNIDRDKYDKFTSYPDEAGERLSVYSAERVIDRRRKVEFIKESGERELVNKSDTPDNLHVVYSSNHIKMDSDFAEDLFRDLINGKSIRIYHPASPPAPLSLTLGNVTFLNIGEDELSQGMVKFLEETYKHAVNRTGSTLSKCLLNSMLYVLREESTHQLNRAIGQIINIYSGNPADGATVSTKENEGPDLVEFKNRQHLENGDSVSNIVEEIRKEKRKGNDNKVFLWGFTEQNRSIDGLRTQSFGDDRISHIEQGVRDSLSDEVLDYREFMLQPINLDGEGGRIAITGVLY